MNDNLRIIVCPHTNKEVVQIKDVDEETGWLCCHNDSGIDTIENDKMDADDVSQLRRDSGGLDIVWNNSTLTKLQRNTGDYDIENL